MRLSREGGDPSKGQVASGLPREISGGSSLGYPLCPCEQLF